MGDQARWDEYYQGVCKYMPWFKQLRVYRMSSDVAAPMFKDGYFDMVYLDGDHTYGGVSRDVKAWLPKVRKGGVLAGHDYNPSGKYDRKLCDVDRAVDDCFGQDFTLLKCTVWYKVVG
jgi:predicted O-methyltransferase YrrM